MNQTSTYDTLRHMADSWGLLALGILFLVLVAWPFLRPGGAQRSEEAASMIFGDEDDGR